MSVEPETDPRPSRLRRTAAPLKGLATVPLRVGGYATKNWARSRGLTRWTEIPDALNTPRLLSHVAMDEAILGVMKTPTRFPSEAQAMAVAADLQDAAALFTSRGWADDPLAYHRTPPALKNVGIRRRWAMGLFYEHVTWDSGFAPRPEEPGAQRWTEDERHRTAHAYVLRHHGRQHPWLVLVHGLGTGMPTADFFGFRVRQLFELGYNIALPVLPLHGPRTDSLVAGTEFLSYDLLTSVHALTQGMWDIRRLIGWLRERSDGGISVYGVSLGGYATALLSVLEPDLDRLIAGIPLVDIPGLFAAHADRRLSAMADRTQLIGEAARITHSVVSPLAAPAQTPTERLSVYAGLGDRMVPPEQALRLWDHWGRPDVCWYPGNHVGFLWSSDVREFVERRLSR